MRRKATSLVLAVLASAVLPTSALWAGSGTAAAAPTGCSWNRYATSGSAYCGGGAGGAYQVYIQCQNATWPFNYVFVEGPWRNSGSGQSSFAQCPWLFEVRSGGVGLRR